MKSECNRTDQGSCPTENFFCAQEWLTKGNYFASDCFVCKDTFFKNGPTPASFSFIFGLFQTNNIILTENQYDKMSIQYTAPGFEPTTFQTRVVTHNYKTRAPTLGIFLVLEKPLAGLQKLVNFDLHQQLHTFPFKFVFTFTLTPEWISVENFFLFLFISFARGAVQTI